MDFNTTAGAAASGTRFEGGDPRVDRRLATWVNTLTAPVNTSATASSYGPSMQLTADPKPNLEPIARRPMSNVNNNGNNNGNTVPNPNASSRTSGNANANSVALVVGATGKTGRRVVERLRARGIETREASRSGSTRFDWNDRGTWAPALEGANLAYVTYSPDLAVPEAVPAIRAFARLAAEREIERLVLLSGRGEEEAQRCEEIVRETNPRWTIVRASWFSQNFSEAFLLEPLRHGVLALPAGEIPEPFVDANDIADVASRALAEEGHEGEIYEVTGPRLLTFAQATQEIAAATKRDIRYEQVPVDVFVEGMRGHGIPSEIVSLTRYLFETVLDGRNAQTADGVRRALGRAPRDFSEYVRNTASTGVWAEPASAAV